MSSIVLKTLNARPEEGTQVYLLLLQGFFTGIFLATYDVGAVTIFLQYFDESTLAWAFVASGVVGVLSTLIYAFFQARVGFPQLVVGYLIIISLAAAFVWYGLLNFTDFKPIAFVAFMLALPFSYIGLLIFWGTFGRIFTVRQAKRIIGGIDTGQLVASIVALFTIGYLIDSGIINTIQLFLFSLFSLGGLLIAFLIIAFKYSLKIEIEEKGGRVKTMPIPRMMANKYIRLLGTFVIISMVAATFVDYSFLTASQTQWPNEADLGAFIARFEAAVVIFSFLFQTFVTDYIIDNYGLRLALLINPALIIILVAGAGFTGLVSNEFVWFFLAIAITKLFIDSLKDALDGPTFKLYFLPIDSMVRFDVSTKIEGTVTALAAIMAGLLLILMNTLQVPAVWVIFIIIPLLIGWFLTTGFMHTNYKTTLQETLTQIRSQFKRIIRKGYSEEITPEAVIENEASVYYSLKLMERLEPAVFERSLERLSENIPKKGKLYTFTQDKMASIAADSTFELAQKALKESAKDGGSLSDPQLYEMAKSPDVNHRIAAALYLRDNISDENVFVLLELLRDISSTVRMEALKTARIVKRSETWGLITDLLGSPFYGNEAGAALYAGGDDVLPVINNVFQRTDTSKETLQRVVKIMARLDSPASHQYMWDKLEFPDRKLVREILLTLRNTKSEDLSESQVGRINNLLDIEIGKAIWNLAAISELKDTEQNHHLIDSINMEIESNFEFIYIYLSILYDPASINLVKENVESGTSDGTTYALELLDIFVSKEIKLKLFPLIDDIPTEEKLERLQVYYPRVSFNELQTLNYIVNRDFNYTNRWTKACALYSLSFHAGAKINQGLIGHLFNPDLLLAENAANMMRKLSEAKLKEIIDRLPDDRKYYLKDLLRSNPQMGDVVAKHKFRFNRVLAMRQLDIFKDIAGLHVSQMVEKFDIVKLRKGDIMDISRHRNTNPLIIVESGSIEISGEKSKYKVGEQEVFGSFFLDNLTTAEHTIEATQNVVIYLLDLSDFLAVLTNFRDMAKEVLERIEDSDAKKYRKPVTA